MVMNRAAEPSSSSCLSGQRFPPGFRFHPTDEELVLYYLKRKICRRQLLLDVVCETDVYKWDPEELPELSGLKTGDRQWYFFSPRDRKYPNGARSNRGTKQGFWKVTGKDRIITCNSDSRDVGVKKTLVFYKGRTPKVERTDWVMHEYTMDEEELRRCHDAQDYYALYKVFKKSGPGPKNGEEYGAPFREEDWVDDDLCPLFDQGTCAQQVNDVALVEGPRPNDPLQCPADDIEELLNQFTDEPPLEDSVFLEYSNALEQLLHEKGTECTLLDHSLQNINLPEQNVIPHAASQYNVQSNINVTQCGTSQIQLPEAPGFTPASAWDMFDPKVVEEDFLEVDDLLGSEPSTNYVNNPSKGLENQHFDGLNEFDLYHDVADVFLHDTGAREAGHPGQQYANNAVNGSVNSFSTYSSDNHENINNQQFYLNASYQGGDQLWVPDQRGNIFTPAEANHNVFPPATSDFDGMAQPCHLSNGENSFAQVEMGEFEPNRRALLLM